ncbi:MAG: chemotaxis protein CheA [Polyangiales bacterium]
MSDVITRLQEVEKAVATGRDVDAAIDALQGAVAASGHPQGITLNQLVQAFRRAAATLDTDHRAQDVLDRICDAIRRATQGEAVDAGAVLAEVTRLATEAPTPPPEPTASAAEGVGCAAPPEGPIDEEPWDGVVAESDLELLKEFLVEASDLLDQAEQGVLTLEEDPRHRPTLDALFRCFHTIKGVSACLEMYPVSQLAHRVESVLSRARDGSLPSFAGVTDMTLNAVDLFRRLLQWVEPQIHGEAISGACPSTTELLARLDAIGMPGNTVPEAPRAVPVAGDDFVMVVPEEGAAPRRSRGEGATSGGATVKVDTAKLDTLVDLVGELVIAHTMVVEDPNLRAQASRSSNANLALLGRVSKDLQRAVMAMRMVPIKATFDKMIRVVRDAGRVAGKPVNLDISGGETELDRTVVEILHDPLVHMVRNAVDHGIESPEGRVAAGKPEVGTIRLKAYHEGGQILVEIADDGKGLDPEKLVAKAREKGLISDAEVLSDAQAFNLIFAAGFSTAAQVTALSGRGVGMDVVRSNIEKARGRVEIESTLGAGTTFRIRLPLTLAIIDGLVVRIGSERFILPTTWAREAFRPSARDINTVQGGSELVSVRGALLPVIHIAQVVGLFSEAVTAEGGTLIIIAVHGRRCCLLVDELIGKQEVVIKSLGETFSQVRGISGGAILGDGRIGLILDVHGLLSASPEGNWGHRRAA